MGRSPGSTPCHTEAAARFARGEPPACDWGKPASGQ
ncbi:hypothetical protein CBM2587_B10147 [Cupriavidus taiwanensis]|uniref:Uncharacterized protein n=1 Tax=Cupriavidus taiwanensis TaxID=164546 RepID=A0A375BXR5_9BURK|nr:hypothetical protein CBM2587_B10147 [Cupriavidus taiwanensis]